MKILPMYYIASVGKNTLRGNTATLEQFLLYAQQYRSSSSLCRNARLARPSFSDLPEEMAILLQEALDEQDALG